MEGIRKMEEVEGSEDAVRKLCEEVGMLEKGAGVDIRMQRRGGRKREEVEGIGRMEEPEGRSEEEGRTCFTYLTASYENMYIYIYIVSHIYIRRHFGSSPVS